MEPAVLGQGVGLALPDRRLAVVAGHRGILTPGRAEGKCSLFTALLPPPIMERIMGATEYHPEERRAMWKTRNSKRF